MLGVRNKTVLRVAKLGAAKQGKRAPARRGPVGLLEG